MITVVDLRLRARSGARPLVRRLATIRFDEVLVLQAPPLLGLAFGTARGALPAPAALLMFLAASCALIAHVFVLNDWSEMEGGHRSEDGPARREMRAMWIALLSVSACLFALLGVRPLLLALAIAALSACYSAPFPHAKGIPVLNSLLHLIGGVLHFLLGYVIAAAPDLRAVAIGSGVALVFAGGHLTQEVRDHEDDRRRGTRTNAVVYGKVATFTAGSVLFTLGFGALFALALAGPVPRALGFPVALLYAVHVVASVAALRSHLSPGQVRRFQWRYRAIFAVLGVALVAELFRGR